MARVRKNTIIDISITPLRMNKLTNKKRVFIKQGGNSYCLCPSMPRIKHSRAYKTLECSSRWDVVGMVRSWLVGHLNTK